MRASSSFGTGEYVGSILPPGMIGGRFAMAGWTRGRDGVKVLVLWPWKGAEEMDEEREGGAVFQSLPEEPALGPVGMAGVADGVVVVGSVGDWDCTGGSLLLCTPPHPDSGRRSLKEPLPPLGRNPPRAGGGLKLRGPEGGTTGALPSGRLGAGIDRGVDRGVDWPDAEGDRIGALKLRLELGPVGALKGCASRTGDLPCTAGDLTIGEAARAGDRSRGVDLVESRRGDLSRGNGERML